MVKHCDRGLENTARGRRAAFSRLSQVNWVLAMEVMQIQERCLSETFSFP